ncbi:LysR family transcriptional regulator [soil metagenome]
MQIDFLGMQAFLSIVDHGGFQQAATHLHLSQTAISHRMRKLEEGLGVKLITRTTRELTLTDAGRSLLPKVRKAMRELEQSCEVLRAGQGDADRWLAFACLPTIAAWQLPAVLQEFAKARPDVPVRVFDNSIREIAELVDSRAAAFGITATSPAATAGRALHAQPLAEEPFVLVCPAGHALAAREEVSWDRLGDEPLIRISLPAGNSATIDDALGERRERLRWAYEAQHTALALNLVEAGLGLTVLPAMSVRAGPGLRLLRLAGPRITRQLAVLTRQGEVLSAAAQLLHDMLVAQIRQTLASG